MGREWGGVKGGSGEKKKYEKGGKEKDTERKEPDRNGKRKETTKDKSKLSRSTAVHNHRGLDERVSKGRYRTKHGTGKEPDIRTSL